LAVEVDSTERKDIPPFGDIVDYLTFGGIYRDVEIRVVPQTFIENVFAKPVDVLKSNRKVDVRVYLNGKGNSNLNLIAELLDGQKVIASATKPVSKSDFEDLTISNLSSVELWDLDKPKLYTVRITLSAGNNPSDHYETRIGFREAKFTPAGFFLNGKHVKLRGLNRHQTYPYVGQAMAARGQKRDALI